MSCHKFDVISIHPYVYCKVFENNSKALELAHLPKMCSRAKHIAGCFHYFGVHICADNINVHPIDTKDQRADIATKTLAQDLFMHHCCQLYGE